MSTATLPSDPRLLMRSIIQRIATGPDRSRNISRTEVHLGTKAILDNARVAGFDTACIVRGVEGGVIPSLRQTGKYFHYHDKADEIEAGILVLKGDKGATYDSLVLAGSIILRHIGKAASVADVAAQLRAVLDSGKAVARVM